MPASGAELPFNYVDIDWTSISDEALVVALTPSHSSGNQSLARSDSGLQLVQAPDLAGLGSWRTGMAIINASNAKPDADAGVGSGDVRASDDRPSGVKKDHRKAGALKSVDVSGPRTRDAKSANAPQADTLTTKPGRTLARAKPEPTKQKKAADTARHLEPALKSATSKNTKADLILKKLRTTKGASIEMLSAETGWQAHSVRGFLSAIVKKKLALNLVSDVSKDGMRRYRIDDSTKST